MAAAVRAAGPMRPPRVARRRAQAEGPAPQHRARPPLGPPPLRRLQRVLQAVPRRVADLLVRDLLARREDARGGPARPSSSWSPTSSRSARATACSTSAAAGAASRVPPPRAARRSPASRCPSRRPSWRAQRAAEAGVADRIDIRVMDWRELRGERSTRSPRSAWSSTSAARTSTPTRARCASCSRPAGGCSTTASPGCATPTPRPAPFSERFVFPDAAPLHVSRIIAGVRARRAAGRPRRGLRERLRRDAAPLGPPASTPTSRRRCGSAAPERVRVWRLYLRAARRGFESGFTSVYQVRATPFYGGRRRRSGRREVAAADDDQRHQHAGQRHRGAGHEGGVEAVRERERRATVG